MRGTEEQERQRGDRDTEVREGEEQETDRGARERHTGV